MKHQHHKPFNTVFNTSDASGGEQVLAISTEAEEYLYLEDLLINVATASVVQFTFGGKTMNFTFGANGGVAKSFLQGLKGVKGSQGGISVVTTPATVMTIAVTGYAGL